MVGGYVVIIDSKSFIELKDGEFTGKVMAEQ